LFRTSPSSSGSLNLTILFGDVTLEDVEPLTGLSATFLQIGNLSFPGVPSWTFCVSGVGHEHRIDAQSSNVRSMIVTVPSGGTYSITAFSGATAGFLTTDEGNPSFEVAANGSFFPEGHFVPFMARTGSRPFTVSFISAFRSRKVFLVSIGLFMVAILDLT
jgi:hypothetical protein